MSATAPARIVVIGGGQAAAQTVFSLRQGGYQGSVTLVSDEPAVPYQRPPLSKAYLKGELPAERLWFRHPEWYAQHAVEPRLRTRVRAIDPSARRVELDGGESLGYDALVIATGARPRRLSLPGADLEGVFELRAVADADRLRPCLVAGARLVIVGAGYIGLEVAASASALGLEVTVLELAPRVLARVTGTLVAKFFERAHRAHGIELRTGVRPKRFEGSRGKVGAVRLDDGTAVPADLVLVAVGVAPNQELAAAAGLDCDDGIGVDRDGRTSNPAVFAAGDCTRRPLVHYARAARLESVHNAVEQGRLAAAAILGAARPVEECPWFWSDQFELKLQIAGLADGHDRVVVRGDPEESKFAAFYLRGDRLLATDAVNSPSEFLGSKKLIARGARVDPRLLADPAVPMKHIVARGGQPLKESQ